MNNFTFQNPVKLIFGKGSIAKLAKEIPADKKIMVCLLYTSPSPRDTR